VIKVTVYSNIKLLFDFISYVLTRCEVIFVVTRSVISELILAGSVAFSP